MLYTLNNVSFDIPSYVQDTPFGHLLAIFGRSRPFLGPCHVYHGVHIVAVPSQSPALCHLLSGYGNALDP